MEKIDRRRNYVIVTDAETANTLTTEDGKLDMSCVLAYDCGWVVADTRGNIYRKRSFVNRDIFEGEKDLMQTAYYAQKIPQYLEDLQSGKRIMSDTYHIRQTMLQDMEDYRVSAIVAHNAYFDLNAYNVLERWTTKSKYRYWFPYGTEIWDTMKMAKSVIHKMPTYQRFCEENGYLTKNGKLRTTAEILHRFISKDNNFDESHTALEDVLIEVEIMAYCFRQHKAMEKELFKKVEEKEDIPPTDFQKALMQSIKDFPTLF